MVDTYRTATAKTRVIAGDICSVDSTTRSQLTELRRNCSGRMQGQINVRNVQYATYVSMSVYYSRGYAQFNRAQITSVSPSCLLAIQANHYLAAYFFPMNVAWLLRACQLRFNL